MKKIDILVADDEPHILRALSFIFEKEGLQVETAVDGEDAIAKYRELNPRIVFLDVAMPKIDGISICREIKTASGQQSHVIMLTCKGLESDRIDCLEAGADEFINKPFSPKEVLEKVKELLKE